MTRAREGILVEGAGNRFLLFDLVRGARANDGARAASEAGDRAHLAREACARARVDGLLFVERDPDGTLRMVIHNADGSRPEACGNGLRCVAAWARRAGLAPEGRFAIATDAGRRAAEVGAAGVRVSMGCAEVGAEIELAGPRGERLVGTPVQVGNPHFVLAREALPDRDMLELGPFLGRHARFPAGTNVELVVRAGEDRFEARVWERGVGETAACGSGACAIAAWAFARGAGRGAIHVRLPGGVLTVGAEVADATASGAGELWLTGPVSFPAA